MNWPFAVFVPFGLLITSSILIIYSMSQLRKRLAAHISNTDQIRGRQKRDLEYAMTILFLDLTFLIFYFPYSFIQFIGNYINYNTDVAIGFYFIFYMGFGNNFFVYLTMKSFRNEIIELIKYYDITSLYN